MPSMHSQNANPEKSFLDVVANTYLNLAQSKYDAPFLAVLLTFEMLLSKAIINFVPYTEIDWIAYMEEVEFYEAGERNYLNIRGGTGPLVYPAGFLYMFSYLKGITENGSNIHKAQEIFGVFYLCLTAVVLLIYRIVARQNVNRLAAQQGIPQDATPQEIRKIQFKLANTLWSWRLSMILLCLSKRVHSIFMLRLFNDGLTMALLYLAVLIFIHNQWRIGCVFFSLAVSIKMNVLLFAPGLLLLLLQACPLIEVIICLGICASIQLVLGAPFLLTFPVEYLRKAFELDRVFFYKWTVNWKFISEEVFVGKPMSIVLLILHLEFLAIFCFKWIKGQREQQQQQQQESEAKAESSLEKKSSKEPLTPEYIVCTMFIANFIGIAFARTLHYQFYSWYFHAIPMLLWWSGTYPVWLRVVIWGAIEYAFNIFPATTNSSAVLQIAHVLVLISIASMRVPTVTATLDDTDNKSEGLKPKAD
mmetsp:Transcript_7732/g.11115  ORF Transcript_7732/g.11115 Transcript_7732/m.11115 type:complete len:475 (-) Transcript_7732:20-1444(-)